MILSEVHLALQPLHFLLSTLCPQLFLLQQVATATELGERGQPKETWMSVVPNLAVSPRDADRTSPGM